MIDDFSDTGMPFLSTPSVELKERRLTQLLLPIAALVCIAFLPFAKMPMARVPIFIPIYETALIIIDLITVVLLFGQYVINQKRSLLCLACAYLFTGCIELMHALSFPGAFSAGGLVSGGPQTTSWLYIFWHTGFPLFAIAYTYLNAHEQKAMFLKIDTRADMVVTSAIVLLIAVALSAFAVIAHPLLPVMIVADKVTPLFTRTIFVVWVICFIALWTLWRVQVKSVLDHWLIVVMWTWIFDIALSALFNGGRYDLGYYSGRIFGCIATGFVLLKLLLENGSLYARLVHAHRKTMQDALVLREMGAQLARANGQLEERNEQLQQASQMKSDFLASMSHELRTPLNAIIGFSDVLKDGLVGELTGEQHEYVIDIFESGQHLLSLINDVLDLSKIEAGKMSLDLEPMEMEPILRNGLSIVRERAASGHVNLKLDISGELGIVLGDIRQTKQIIFNLLSNAVKFTPERGLVTLSARIVDRSEVENWTSVATTVVTRPLPTSDFTHFLEIAVSDTGQGISPADAPRLFQAFSQLDTSLSRAYEGTGLGLALVLKLAQLHAGTVALASSTDVGSRFTVWLPYRSVQEEGVVSRQKIAALPSAPSSRAKRSGEERVVLVIEDNQHAADLIALQLRSVGFRVQRAANAMEAKYVLAQRLPILIVLDILLPDMDGWDFLAQIKYGDTPLAKVPVVIVSILADRTRGLSLGAADVLQKPVTHEQLQNTLSEIGLIKNGQTATILVIDDDPKSIDLITTVLQGGAYRVLQALNGADGVQMCRLECPDLIVLDLVMPEVDGFDVISALAENVSTAGIPIVVVTAKTLSHDERLKLHERVDAIMEKGAFDRMRFSSEIQRVLH